MLTVQARLGRLPRANFRSTSRELSTHFQAQNEPCPRRRRFSLGTYDLQYLCRDGPGTEVSLVDLGKLGLNLPASLVGLMVVAVGPYV